MSIDTACTQPRCSVDNFIDQWLCRASSSAYTAFKHISLTEIEGARTMVFSPLAQAIFIHHNDPEEYRENLRVLGYPELARTLDKRPHNSNARKCNFGEIVASEFFRQSQGYQFLIYRLRYNPNPDSSMKGDDVLAFKFGEADGTGKAITVIEAKVRKNFESRAVDEAYNQLKDGHRPRPKSIPFVVTILRSQGRHDEANQVLSFLDSFAPVQPTQHNIIFLITGNTPRDPFGSIQRRGNVMANLLAVNACVPELDEFINALFDYEVNSDGS
jgi:hypothetical protein